MHNKSFYSTGEVQFKLYTTQENDVVLYCTLSFHGKSGLSKSVPQMYTIFACNSLQQDKLMYPIGLNPVKYYATVHHK